MLVMDAESGSTVRLRERLTVRLTAGVILTLLVIGVPFLLAFHGLWRDQHLEVLAEARAGMSRVLVDSLRSAMLAGKPHLLDQAIRDLSRQPEVERVVVLDREGAVRFSSDPAFQGRGEVPAGHAADRLAIGDQCGQGNQISGHLSFPAPGEPGRD